MNTRLWLLAAAALWATPALADHHEEKSAETAEAAKADAGDSAKRVMDALQLPAKAEKLRTGGMSSDEVAGALDAAKGAGLSAGETTELLDAADAGADGDAWQGNFGSWVKTQIAEGKRGQDLKAAIGAEKDNRKAAKEAAKADGTWKGRGQEMKANAGEMGKKAGEAAGDAAGKAGEMGKKAGNAMGKSAERAGNAAKKTGEAAGASAKRAGNAAAKEADKAVDGAGKSAGRARAGAAKAADKAEDTAKKTGSAGRARANAEKKDN